MTPAERVPFTAGDGLAIKGETAGEGPPIVLCHGLTATRDSVVHGSRALERGGYRQVSYDARGHGQSDPPPAGEGYGYPELVGDLESVVAVEAGEEPFVPRRQLEWVPIPPSPLPAQPGATRRPDPDRAGLSRRDRRCGDGVLGRSRVGAGDGGVDGFVEHIDRFQAADPGWRESILRFTRSGCCGIAISMRWPGHCASPALAAVRRAGGAGVGAGAGAVWSPATTPPTPATRASSPRPTRSAWRGRG